MPIPGRSFSFARPGSHDSIRSCAAGFKGCQRTEEARLHLSQAFNACGVHLPWKVLEPIEGEMNWQPFEDILAWAESGRESLPVLAGPLLDFSGYGLPDWLWGKDLDLTLLCDYLCEYVERIVRRYKGRVQHWHIAAGSNLAGVVARSEDELLWLTLRLLETARQANADAELCVGLAQPCGDYLARQEHTHSPLAYADTLLRTGVKLAALELELVMGVSPRGSYCRSTLEVSRLIDMYSYLGVPLQLTMGYPSDVLPDPLADRDLTTHSGHWHSGLTSACQADWAEKFTTLALCAPAVRTVMWSHFDDGLPHQFPHAGLVDAKGNVKPALERLLMLRKEHLK